MESTLERLLRIQGAAEQMSIEMPPAPPPAPPAPPPPPPDQRQEAAAAAQGQPTGTKEKPSSPMLEAWRGAYRTFTKYASALRIAAHKDDENEEAAALFMAAAEELKAIYAAGGDAEILSTGLYEMLEAVYNQEKAKESQ